MNENDRKPVFKRVVDDKATGEKMRKLRISHGFSLQDMRERLLYTEGVIERYENGEYKWTDSMIEKYCDALESTRTL